MEKRETSPKAFEARIILTGLDRIPELKRYLLRQLNWANIFQQRMDKRVLTGRLVNQSAFTVSGWGLSRFYPRSSVSIHTRGTAVPHFSACSMAFLFSPTFYPLVGQVYLFSPPPLLPHWSSHHSGQCEDPQPGKRVRTFLRKAQEKNRTIVSLVLPPYGSWKLLDLT